MNLKSIPLTESELKVVEELRPKYSSLPTDLLENLEGLLRQTRILLTRVAENAKDELRESHHALMGIVCRTRHLLLGGVQQITNPNKHVWGACLRGLIETFGAIAWVSEKLVRLPALIQRDGPRLGSLLNVAYKGIQGLKDDYDRLSDWVHPGSVSLLLGLRAFNQAQKIAIFAVPEPPVSPNEAQIGVEILVAVCGLIYKDVQALLDLHLEVISSGKPPDGI